MKKLFPLALFVFLAVQANAQNFPYFFSVKTATYSNLVNDTAVVATYLDPGEPWDDDFFEAPLGFDFFYLGTTGDSIYNPATAGAVFIFENPAHVSDSADYLGAYGNDLIDRGSQSGIPSSPITYVTEGAPGNRIFKLQYKNAGFFNENFELGTLDNHVDFQLWLFEGSNDFEIHFGPSDFSNPLDTIDEYSGPLVTVIDSLSTSSANFAAAWILFGDPGNPMVKSLAVEEADTLYQTLFGYPAEGTVYRFGTSPNVGVEDLHYADAFKLYPTLVQDRILMEISEPDWFGKQAIMQIIDNQGRLLIRYQTSLETSMEMELQQLPAGIYYFTLMAEDIHLSKKLIKQ